MPCRTGRWVTRQVGHCARSVLEVATELGCDWHTVNDAVVRRGEALVDHAGRFGAVAALGLDETLMVHTGPFRRQAFSTQVVDVGRGATPHSFCDSCRARTAMQEAALLASQQVGAPRIGQERRSSQR